MSNTKPKTSTIQTLTEPEIDQIVDTVVDRLRPEIQKLKDDILAEIPKPPPKDSAGPPPEAIAQLLKGLTGNGGNAQNPMAGLLGGGGMDGTNVLSNLMQMSANAPVDYSKLTESQIEARKADQRFQMLLAVAPQLIQSIFGQNANPLMAEMVNRIVMDKIASSVMFDKAIMQKLIGDLGGLQRTAQQQQAQTAWLTNPIMQANQNIQNQPIQNVPGQGNE